MVDWGHGPSRNFELLEQFSIRFHFGQVKQILKTIAVKFIVKGLIHFVCK